MSNELPGLDQLSALEAIVDAGSFSAAAEKLHRSTSTLSYSIRTLEASLGVELFDRSGHRAALTEAGQLVLEQARAVLGQARELGALAEQLREGWEARLVLVLDGVLPIEPVMHALRRFCLEEAPTKLELRVEYLSGVQECFEREEADLMLALDYQPARQLGSARLPALEMLLVAHREHPLHALVPPVSRRRMMEHVELVVADSGSGPKSASLPGHSMRDLRLGGARRIQLADFHSKREALLSGVGYGWLPRHLADDLVDRGELRLVPFEEGDRLVFAPFIVARQRALAGRGAKLFLRLLGREIGCELTLRSS